MIEKAEGVLAIEGKEPGKRRRRRTGTVERAGHLASWDRSGLSGREYARLNGLKATDLYRWRKLENADTVQTGEGELNRGGFLTIDVDGVPGGAGGLKVVLRQGPLEVEVSGGGSAEELARLAGALRREVLDA